MYLTLREKYPDKYGVFSGLYFPVFNPNTGKYGPEKTPHLDTFHTLLLRFAHLDTNPRPIVYSMHKDKTHLLKCKIVRRTLCRRKF